MKVAELSPLPDENPHSVGAKWSSVGGAQELRVRRGLGPMRFRLDSVGGSSSASTPSSPTPLTFDLVATPTLSAASSVSFFADDGYSSSPPSAFYDAWSADTPAAEASPLPPAASIGAAHDTTDAAAASCPTANWRQVGRDLRGIADHFASTRASNRSQVNCNSIKDNYH